MAIDKTKNTQVLLTLPKQLKSEIEDYQFKNKIPSRSAAMRILLEKGLAKK